MPRRYQALVDQVPRGRARRACRARSALAEAVARYYCKLLAYKDEYEVARLYTDPPFRERIAAQFEGDYQLQFHLAPPLVAAARPGHRPHRRRQSFGPWMLTAFRLLAQLKGLRGTAFDPFGRSRATASSSAA